MGSTQLPDEELIRALYAEHGSSLLAFVQRLLNGDRAAAEDIVQETLLRAWRHSAELDVDRVRPWLFTTARRLVVDAQRARDARPAEAPAGELPVAATIDSADAALNAAIVLDALGALTAPHRAILIDYFYRGRTAADRRGTGYAARNGTLARLLRDACDAARLTGTRGGRAMTCVKQTWLGAYVLDALEPGEAEDVSNHIAGCPTCQDEVVRLAWIPGLLRTVTLEDITGLDDWSILDGSPQSSALDRPRTASRGKRTTPRWRRSVVVLAGLAAAAAIAGAAAIGIEEFAHTGHQPVAIRTVDPHSHVQAA